MKHKMVAAAFLILILSTTTMSADAAPWRGHRGYGWYAPRPVVRVYVPAPRVWVPPVVVAGGYYHPHYYGHPYYGHAHGYYGPRHYR